MSVVVQDQEGKTQLVTKGAVEEMLQCCAWAECGGKVLPLRTRCAGGCWQKPTS